MQEENTAKSGWQWYVAGFATPSMLALMEAAASESVAPYLEAGCGTVGTRLDVRHLSATPVGMKVSAESEVAEVEGKTDRIPRGGLRRVRPDWRGPA